MVDYYAVAGIEREAEADQLKTVLNSGLMEYHPDQLQGLAPDLRHKGAQMARSLVQCFWDQPAHIQCYHYDTKEFKR